MTRRCLLHYVSCLSLLWATGCLLRKSEMKFDSDLARYRQLSAQTEYADVTQPVLDDQRFTPAPRTIRENAVPQEYWNMPLEEAIQIAFTQARVLRDLGASVVRIPGASRTILGPAIQAADPRTGMEAALSAFDTSIGTSVFFEKNDRLLNNFFAAGGARIYQQDLGTFQTQISKQAATGTMMSLRGNSVYDANNATGNRFGSSWNSNLEAEVRHPLLQGGGVEFNRIAGPNATPGNLTGVVLARVNMDVSLAEFELGLRDLASNVENAYWDLAFAYRDLDARINMRNASLEVWRLVRTRLDSGQLGAEEEREAQAQEQYLRAEEEVQNALSGRLIDGTTTFDGSSGGTFRGTGGVLLAERRLRLLIGLPITDERLIRPADEPARAKVEFDWESCSAEALTRRPELRRQQLQVRRRELELMASRNFLLPDFDVVTRYRWAGLGKNLIGGVPIVPDPTDPGGVFGNGSLENLFQGDFQEWQLGGELTFPIGFRRAHAAVRHAQLELARERAILDEQQRQIVFDLSNALSDLERAYRITHTNFDRREAARKQVGILRDKFVRELPVNLDELLDAERRFADSDIQYQRSLVEYMLAMRNVHFEKGSLLEYCEVYLAETRPSS